MIRKKLRYHGRCKDDSAAELIGVSSHLKKRAVFLFHRIECPMKKMLRRILFYEERR